MDHIAEIKHRLPIEELVSQYVQLKKVGRNFKGLCPFHSERSPSFYVSTDKQLAYCFGCRKGGDHFKFIQEIEHIDFPEALKILAEKARVELPNLRPEQRERIKLEKSLKDRVFEMHLVAQDFFEEMLWGEAGKAALSYIQGRGMSDELIRQFHIGYAPARGANDELYRLLLKKGYSVDECEKSGLVLTRGTDSSSHFDRFRNRLMIPITNPMGRVCAFGGRALAKDDEPKYLNSPETPTYHKSAVLFGLSEAKADIRSKGYVVCVEGYMDMIAAYQAGVRNVVATSGTALTKEHLELLKKQTDRLVFSFDADSAGRQATLRALETALPLGLSISVAVWPGEAKDPDELCKQHPEDYVAAVSKPTPVSLFLIDYFKNLHGIETIEQRVACAQGLMPYIARTESPLFVDEWLKQASHAFQVSIEVLYKELQRFRKQLTSSSTFRSETLAAHGGAAKQVNNLASPVVNAAELTSSKVNQRAEYLLGLVLTFPESLSVINQLVHPEIFLDPELQKVYRTLLEQYNQCSGNGFCFDDALSERAQAAQLYCEHMLAESGRELAQADATQEVLSVSLQLARTYISRQKFQLQSQIRLAGTKEQKEDALQNFQELLSYEHRLSTLP